MFSTSAGKRGKGSFHLGVVFENSGREKIIKIYRKSGNTIATQSLSIK
jgi:hypothetical protein